MEFSYEDGRDAGEEAWHVSTDGVGFSLVIADERGPIENWDVGAGWRPSFSIGGSPASSDSPLVNADFDEDGDVDVDDLDLLSDAARRNDAAFDVNQDGVTDGLDRELVIRALLGTSFGDSNLDRVFDSRDFVLAFTAGQYEDEIPGNSGWAQGDWDGDGDFTTRDLVAAFQAGGYEQPAAASERLEPALDEMALSFLRKQPLPDASNTATLE